MTQNPGNFIENEALKGGEFIIKDTLAKDTFIPEELNEEQEMVRQMCKDFVQNDVKGKANKLDAQPSLVEKAGELGLLGSHIPEDFGGMGMDTHTNTLITEELGHSGGGFTTTFAAHTGIGMLPILYFGTKEQKLKYLPPLASGEQKAAYCLTDPSSGSDALAAKTRADLSEDGKFYILNGQKMWISNAGFADVFVVFAQIEGDKFTGFIVEAKTEGISLGAEEEKMGIKGSSTRQVFFENVKVPVENLLGAIGKGHLIAFNILNVGRYKLGAMSMGGCKNAVTLGTKYANERIQFKVPISSFGAIQFKLAEQAIKTFALESSVYRISDLLSEKKIQLQAQGKSYEDAVLEAAEEYAIECAMIKIIGSEAGDYVMDELVQIHGGNGFSEEYPAAAAYRDTRISRIYEGTNEINRLLTVNMLIKAAMKGKFDLATPAWAVQKELATPPTNETLEGTYATEKKALKDFKKAVLMIMGAAFKMQMDGKINLREEQMILMNVADMMIDTFNAESLLLRIEKMGILDETKQPMEVYEAILKTFITDATARIHKNGTDALTGFAEGDALKAMLNGLNRFTQYTPTNVKVARRLIASKLIEANGYCL